MRDGAWLIAWGYFQKVFVADNLAGLANSAFDPAAPQTGVNVLLGVYAFAFQIYGTLPATRTSRGARRSSWASSSSRTSAFRISCGRRRRSGGNWHISLSTWLRDYLYIPLGGSRGSEWRTRRNLFITMVLGGLWHGAAWTFVFWGIYHGLLLIAYRAAERWHAFRWLVAGPHLVARIVSWAVMFHVTCYGWLIFRARSAGQIGELTASLIANFAPATINVHGLLVPLLLYTTPLARRARMRGVVR